MSSTTASRIGRPFLFVLLPGVLLFGPLAAPAQTCIDYIDYAGPAPLLGSIPGFGVPTDVVVTGDRVYVAGSRTVMAFDRSDPVKPVLLGELEVACWALAAEGSLVFGYDIDGNLLVMDFSDPADPQVALHPVLPDISDCHMALSGDILYLQLNHYPFAGYFLAVDVSDPAQPAVLSQVENYLTWDISLAGDHAYLAMSYGESSNGMLGVMDISDPAHPQLVAQLDLGLAPDAVEVTAPYAYVSTPTGIRVVDVSDPLDPEVLMLVSGLFSTWGLERAGTDKLVCYGVKYGQNSPGLRVLDISQPAAPVFVGSEETVPTTDGLAGDAATVYAISAGWGLRVFDITDPALPQLEGWTHGMPGVTYNFAAGQDHAFLAGYDLRVVDTTDPTDPRLVQTYPMPCFGNDVALADDLLVWVGSHPGGGGSGLLALVDVRNPQLPVLRGSVVLPDYPLEVAVHGSYAYGAGQSDDLLVIDISDVDNPAYAGHVDIPDGVTQAVSVSGDLAFVGAGSLGDAGGLYIMDLADPAQPEIIGHLALGPAMGNVILDGDRAFMIDQYDRSIVVADISDPTAPLLVHREESFGTTWSLFYRAPHLYQGTYDRLNVLDVTDHTQMVVAGYVEFEGIPRELKGTGPAIGVAAGYDGFYLVGLDCAGVASVDGDSPAGSPLAARLDSHPNPFNPRVTISYRLDRPGPMRLAVHDLRGRLVRVLEQGYAEAGQRSLNWSGVDQAGRQAPSGTYLLRLTGAGGTDVRKVSLVR